MYVYWGGNSSSLLHHENEKVKIHEKDFVGFGVNSFFFFFLNQVPGGLLTSLLPDQLPILSAENSGEKCLLPTDLIFVCSSTIDLLGLFINLLITSMFYLGASFVNHLRT